MVGNDASFPASPVRWGPLVPLVLATMASQALLIVLSPTIVAIGAQLGASVGAVGQARSVTAAAAIATSLVIVPRVDRWGVRRLLRLGATVAISGCAAVAASPTLPVFLAAHALVGVGFACLLSAGFAGVSATPPQCRTSAVGYVAGANALAWIVVNPVVGVVTDRFGWRAALAVPAAVSVAALATSGAVAPMLGAGAPLSVRALIQVVSARRWLVAELIAYAAWTALLTFVGPFLISRFGVGEAALGWLLSGAAAAYLVCSTRSSGLSARFATRHLVAGSALLMGLLLPVQLGLADTVTLAVGVFWVIGLVAGIRTPLSSALGLQQLSRHPGAIMTARTATTQLGYLIGAVVGGALVDAAGYATLGLLLGAGMLASAVLVLGVEEPARGESGQPGASRGVTSSATSSSWRRSSPSGHR